MQYGTLAEWFAALFTGLTAFVVWWRGRPTGPIFEVDRLMASGVPKRLRLIVRNPDQRYAITMVEIWAEPRDRWSLNSPDKMVQGWRIEPGRAEGWECTLDGEGPRPSICCTIRSQRRTRRYSEKL